jgi:hypothetical protein
MLVYDVAEASDALDVCEDLSDVSSSKFISTKLLVTRLVGCENGELVGMNA